MFAKLYDYYFWFTQPATILSRADFVFGYLFLAVLLLAIILGVWARFIPHEVVKKLVKKFFLLTLNLGLVGLFWLAVRFENIPILAERFWAGLILILGLVWLLFIVKYLIFDFRPEKLAYEKEQVKNKYIPRKR